MTLQKECDELLAISTTIVKNCKNTLEKMFEIMDSFVIHTCLYGRS